MPRNAPTMLLHANTLPPEVEDWVIEKRVQQPTDKRWQLLMDGQSFG